MGIEEIAAARGNPMIGSIPTIGSMRQPLYLVRVGPPPLTVDTAIFEMSLGSLSAHRGLAIPVV